MAEEPLNPYAPPSGDPGNPIEEARQWGVFGGVLAVRNGARLPPVDLEGDGGSAWITPVIRQCTLSFRKISGASSSVRFFGYISVESFKARLERSRWRNRLSGWGLLAFIPGVYLHYTQSREGSDVAMPLVLLGLVGIFGSVIWQSLDAGVRCTGFRDGWYFLKGISPRSLALLAAGPGRCRSSGSGWPTGSTITVCRCRSY